MRCDTPLVLGRDISLDNLIFFFLGGGEGLQGVEILQVSSSKNILTSDGMYHMSTFMVVKDSVELSEISEGPEMGGSRHGLTISFGSPL